MYSDCGKNFTAADKVLKKEMQEMEKEIELGLARKGFQWVFNPPYAPHRGGVWERIIALFKRHLKTALTGDAIRLETFMTIVVEVEGIMNRRPITSSSTEATDEEALTPLHLLAPASIQRPEDPRPTAKQKTEKEVLQSAWKRAQSRISAFWVVFRKDYLTTLALVQKWRKTKKDLEVDDLVIIADDTVGRDEWRLGRVIKVFSDGQHVRKAEVLRNGGKVDLRDRSRLIKLELESE